jgi:hypothetical protein
MHTDSRTGTGHQTRPNDPSRAFAISANKSARRLIQAKTLSFASYRPRDKPQHTANSTME